MAACPKRWVVYTPLLLLPSGSFSSGGWGELFGVLGDERKSVLFGRILESVAKREGKRLSRLAVNKGIPFYGVGKEEGGEEEGGEREENVLRSPSGLLMLHGDFGPDFKGNDDDDGGPIEKDFKEAFWVCTKQNGIEQVWAPRWTMFSRGNVKEKARILGFHDAASVPLSTTIGSLRMEKRIVAKRERANWTVIDLYAGIGYFVFSYVGMGVGRVIGWELNGWSVEGLRRGAVANAWSVRVIRHDERLRELGDEKITVFLESNIEAEQRLQRMDNLGMVKHVNCGFLPTSEPTWKLALSILTGDGWLHLHENVGVGDVERRKEDIESMLRDWLGEREDGRKLVVQHVEFVKTFAPGVWHCVFDVYVGRWVN